ncbi:MAG: heat-inducible transcription repressor HrcA [Clostridia bacterium]|nr:heat-inducible transcription repressor HrcA [Clostridia bacterium]
MELSERKREVLAAVTKAYLATGEPVGSKALSVTIPNAPSPATLRNEMSELCGMGLLKQPHTSAGRIPTDLGMKLYIETLMPPGEIPLSAKRYFDHRFSAISAVPEAIPALVGEILSEWTGLPVVTCFSAEKSPRVQKVEMMPVGKSTATVLLVSSDGRVRHRMVRLPVPLTGEIVDRFRTAVRERVKGRQISECDRAALQSVVAACGTGSLDLTPLLAAVFEMASEMELSGAQISGASALYHVCGSETAAKRVIGFVKQGFPILALAEKIRDDCGVIIGRETGFEELRGASIVAAKYRCIEQYHGMIGVIGRSRMPYDSVIPCVQYAAARLTEMMAAAQKDMED